MTPRPSSFDTEISLEETKVLLIFILTHGVELGLTSYESHRYLEETIRASHIRSLFATFVFWTPRLGHGKTILKRLNHARDPERLDGVLNYIFAVVNIACCIGSCHNSHLCLPSKERERS